MNNLDIERYTDWLNRTIFRLDGDHLVRHEQLFLLFQVDPQGILGIIIIIFVGPKGILEIITIIIIIIVVNPQGMLERQCYSSSFDEDSNYREVNIEEILLMQLNLQRS